MQSSGKAPPRVSVVMAVHNGEAWISDALRSLQAQQWRDVEIIVVDDASTDQTPTLLKQFDDPRLVPVFLTENVGLTRALNVGLSHARGELIARQDADDLSLPGRLAAQVEFLDRHPEVGILGTRCLLKSPTGERPDPAPSDETELRFWMMLNNGFSHSSIMFRRSLLSARIPGYPESMTCAQDYALWSGLLPETRLLKLPETLVILREHPGQISQARRAEQMACSTRVSLGNLTRLLDRPVNEAERSQMLEAYPACPLPATEASLKGGRLVMLAFQAFLRDPLIQRRALRKLRRAWALRFLNSWTLQHWRESRRTGLVRLMFRALPLTTCWYISLRIFWATAQRLGVRYRISSP